MRFLLRAVRLITGDPSLRKYVWGPLAASGAVLIVAIWIAYLLLVPILARIAERSGLERAQAETFAGVGFVVLALIVSGVLFATIAGLFSSFLWDGLSRQVEARVYGSAVERSPARAVLIRDTVSRGVFSGIVGFLGLLLSCFGFPGPVAAGWIALHDYTAPAFLRRGITFSAQRKLVRRLPEWPVFFAISGLLTILPLVNVFALPILVSAGTLMVADAESKGALN